MDRGHINVMLVSQSCTDSLHVMAGSCTETFPTSCDGTLDIGNIKVEEHTDIKEEEEVNVKTEKVIGSEEGIYCKIMGQMWRFWMAPPATVLCP